MLPSRGDYGFDAPYIPIGLAIAAVARRLRHRHSVREILALASGLQLGDRRRICPFDHKLCMDHETGQVHRLG